ncbi:hypothetical protein FRC07_006240 [Ceratobasidium sp. 392]|nr:hypothetical protein FRC07_006240 [Ceratobasidium sp. 392]
MAVNDTRGDCTSVQKNAVTRVKNDVVTSQMLAWLITNCEDSRSVDTALLAIAGADSGLPCEPLFACQAHELAFSRLDNYLELGDNPPEWLRFYRTYGVLVRGEAARLQLDKWAIYDLDTNQEARIRPDMYKRWASYFQLIDNTIDRFRKTSDPNIGAAAVIPMMHTLHWRTILPVEAIRLMLTQRMTGESAMEFEHGMRIRPTILAFVTNVLDKLLEADSGSATLCALVDSTVHYFVGLRPRQEPNEQSSLLPILLARVFFKSYDPDRTSATAQAAAIVLAAATFAARPYPGGETGWSEQDVYEKRAMRVWKYYQARRPLDKNTTLALFFFGFFGLLPHIDFSNSATEACSTHKTFEKCMRLMAKFDFSTQPEIHTIPLSHSAVVKSTIPPPASIRDALVQVIRSSTESSDDNHSATATIRCLPFLLPQTWAYSAEHRSGEAARTYASALLSFCHAQSTELQEFYMGIIDRLPVPEWPLDPPAKYLDSQSDFEQLCRAVIDADASVLPIAALHFGLLVASMILKLSYYGRPGGYLVPLQLLANLCEEYNIKLKDPSPLSEETMLARLSKDIEDGSISDRISPTMQSVVDFCEAGFNRPAQRFGTNPRPLPSVRLNTALDKLEERKKIYKPGTAKLVRSISHARQANAPTSAQATATSKVDVSEVD